MNSKLIRTTVETIVIVTLVILAVLGIVSILWRQDTVGASGNANMVTIRPPHFKPQPAAVYQPLTWTIARSMGGTVDTANGCHTYLLSDRFGGVDNLPAVACKVVTVETVTVVRHEQNTTVTVETITENPVTVVTVETKQENPTVTVTETPRHCNNGNGNGAEGCNASDSPHSNQDETPERQDNTAGETHGNSDNSHGNGGDK